VDEISNVVIIKFKKMKSLSFLFVFVSMVLLNVTANPPKKTTTVKPIKQQVVISNVADDAVKYNKSNTTEEIVVEGKDVLISGNDNKLTIKGEINKVLITGKNNDITIVAVNEIKITGSGNFVSWEKTNNNKPKPEIQDKGGYNNVAKRSGNTQTKEEN
jgi:hypothetical protein